MSQVEVAASSVLSRSELDEAIEALTADDKARLRAAARRLSYGRPADGDDLLQEALMRVMSGERRFPKDESFLPFIFGVMQSIRSSQAKHVRRMQLRLVPGAGGPPDPTNENPVVTPEEAMFTNEEAQRIMRTVLSLFEDDEAAQAVLEADCAGFVGEELRELTGLSETELATKRRLIRRRIARTFPKGWVP